MPKKRTKNEEESDRKPHLLFVPFPAQGHINLALAFARCLASKGVLITTITTTKISKSAIFSHSNSISVHIISNGAKDVKETESPEDCLKRFKAVFSDNLGKFIDEQKSRGCCPEGIVYDSFMPWVLDIAHERELLGASFFCMCGIVNASTI